MTPQVVRVRAYAKINLSLRVLGVRSDGYHELRTVFQTLALHDTLTFERRRGPFSLAADDPLCPVDESNLVWKAAQRLWVVSGRRGSLPGTRVRLTKRVPAQAGLGGGSSDAASALRALRSLWQLSTSDHDLAAIGRSLGADVACFFEGGRVLGVERGDVLYPLEDAPRQWVVVARPDFGVSTADAYGWWDAATRTGNNRRAADGEWTNDLQAPVGARHPRILRLIRQLERSGAHRAAMSGSGSAVFGLFDERRAADRAAASVSGRRVKVWLTRTTTRREHQRLSRPLVR